MANWMNSFKKTKKVFDILTSLSPILFVLMPVVALINAIAPFINYLMSVIIIDELSNGAKAGSLITYATIAIGLNVFILLITNLLAGIRDVQVHKLNINFEKQIAEKMLELDYIQLEDPYVNDLKRSMDQSKLRIGGITKIILLFEEILKSGMSLILAIVSVWRILLLKENAPSPSFWTSPWPLFTLLIFITGSIVWTFKMQLKSNEKITDLNTRINEANGSAFMFMQMMSDYHNGKDIRIYQIKDFLCKYFNDMWESSIGIKLMREISHLKGFTPGISSCMSAFITVFAYLLAGMKAANGEISIGTIVLYAGSIQIFSTAVSQVIFAFGELLGGCDLQQPFLEFFALENKMAIEDQPLLIERNGKHTVEFKNISFRYPNSDQWALYNINLKITAGERIAIVGMNGSGKTTLIKLLCRLYDPTEGVILLDDCDIKSYSLEEYRRLFGVVFQDFRLLSLSLKENVVISKEGDTDKLERSLDMVGLTEWAQKLPRKLDTPLYQDYAEDGVEISGGEAQKIAIARAIYKSAPMIVLDEPTASLDPRAEYEIFMSFDQLIENKTAIYISHRLSSCRFCGRILVFHEGQIIQEGKHQALVEDIHGKYYELWHAQSQFYE